MSDLTYTPDRPGRLLVPGATIKAQTRWGRTIEVRVQSVTHGECCLWAWDAEAGRLRRVWLQAAGARA